MTPSDSILERRFWPIAIALTLIVFAAIAPTVAWLEFSNSAEALNVATAQELRRGEGNWLIPTLQGQTRLQKPPLTAWLTASVITDSTMQQISSIDAAERANGFRKLAWQTRWPALLAGCVILLATAEIGRLIAGPACGPLSLVVAGSSFLFLRFTRYNTTDIHLAMWVCIANVLFLRALILKQLWAGFIGGGIAVGLAMLSKGPVALVQSVLPILVWMILDFRSRFGRSSIAPIIAGMIAFAVVALPWFIIVLIREPDALKIWFSEVTRQGATEDRPDRWYSYFVFIPYLAPWFIFFVGGAIVIARKWKTPALLPLLMTLIPLLVMSLAKDRNERYMLPMLAPAAVVAAIGVMELLRLVPIRASHAALIALIATGFPVAVLFVQPPWYSTAFAIAAAIGGAIILATGIAMQRRQQYAIAIATFIAMLALQAVFILGYRHTREGRAELRPMAEDIVQRFPKAEVFNAHPRGKRPPPELGVYLNRILRWTDDPSQIPRESVPKVLLMLQNRSDPEPTPPPGWELVTKYPRDKDNWWAFFLSPLP